MRIHLSRGFTLLFVLGLLLTACQGQPTAVLPAPSAAPATPLASVFTAIPSTATPTPPAKPVTSAGGRTLVICLGREPGSLYLYGASSLGMWSVLEAIYDGPFDTRKFTPQPVILEKLPTLAAGDAVVEPVEMKAGDLVVDANGNLAALAAGTRVLPSGCSGADCAVAWDGKKALKMDRLKLSYRLLPGLKWSDGAPLSAADSVYSFNLVSDPATRVSKRISDRTESYTALDDLSVVWVGRPGYAPQALESLFFLPLPRHAWEAIKPADMEKNATVTRQPLGWGPYQIVEWKAGSNIRLVRNPNYFKAGAGLPRFDTLVFRFLGEPGDNNLTAVQSGECDVVDQTTLVEDQLRQIVDLQNSQKLRAYIGQGPQWEHLDFGIKPAGYDDGLTLGKDRADFFGDVRVRQAFAACINRPGLIKQLLFNLSSVPASYLPPGHPMLPADLAALPYDVAAGSKLLGEAGWKDLDNNPATPRTAQGVANVPNGTAFVVNYYTSEATLRRSTAEAIAQNLADCGVQVKVNLLNPGQLYAPGPDGVLFGRNFDLAQFSWETGSQPPCGLYESSAIPTAKNNWIGGNLTGYSSAAYDTACARARQARGDPAEVLRLNQEALRLLAKELPMIPLYFPLQIALSRPDFCGLELDVSARSLLWNLENYEYGPTCKP